MTSHELAKTLLEDPDLPVTRRGYEGGVEIISEINPPTPLHLDAHGEKHIWWYGAHEYHEDDFCCFGVEDPISPPNEDGSHTPPRTLAIHLS